MDVLFNNNFNNNLNSLISKTLLAFQVLLLSCVGANPWSPVSSAHGRGHRHCCGGDFRFVRITTISLLRYCDDACDSFDA